MHIPSSIAVAAFSALAAASPLTHIARDVPVSPDKGMSAMTMDMPMDKPMSMPMQPASSSPMNMNTNTNMPMDSKPKSGMGSASMGTGMGMGMSMPPAIAKNPVTTKIAPLFHTAQNPTERIRIRYGPFTMAASNDTTLMLMPGMEDEGGVVDVSWSVGEPVKPCSNCILKQGAMTLEYASGESANIDSGAWLHHATLAVVGGNRRDYACPDIQKQGMGILGGDHERFMVVHNDRNATFWGANAADRSGFWLGGDDQDKLAMVLELKNELPVEKKVYLVQEFEYLPDHIELPEGWMDVKAVWLDAQPCGAVSSEIHPPKVGKNFVVESAGWVAPDNVELLTTVGHMHDGGTSLLLFVNNQKVCTSLPKYNADPAYTPSKAAISMGAQDVPHISSYTPCVDFGSVNKGDNVTLRAVYDFAANAPAVGRSRAPVGVMGIAMTMVGIKKG